MKGILQSEGDYQRLKFLKKGGLEDIAGDVKADVWKPCVDERGCSHEDIVTFHAADVADRKHDEWFGGCVRGRLLRAFEMQPFRIQAFEIEAVVDGHDALRRDAVDLYGVGAYLL